MKSSEADAPIPIPNLWSGARGNSSDVSGRDVRRRRPPEGEGHEGGWATILDVPAQLIRAPGASCDLGGDPCEGRSRLSWSGCGAW